ncbi:MAG: hypothetical protein L0H73_13480 [Nitrococcus sp.]|nr:hypothetical protein [Nitrococcus sp.]
MRRFSVIIILSLALAGCAATLSRAPDAGAQLEVARKAWLVGNYEHALPLLTRLARAGNPRAQYALGYMYYMGQGVEQSQRTALVWIRRAANNGDPLAIQALGRIASGSLANGASAQQQRSGEGQEEGSARSFPAPAPAAGNPRADPGGGAETAPYTAPAAR